MPSPRRLLFAGAGVMLAAGLFAALLGDPESMAGSPPALPSTGRATSAAAAAPPVGLEPPAPATREHATPPAAPDEPAASAWSVEPVEHRSDGAAATNAAGLSAADQRLVQRFAEYPAVRELLITAKELLRWRAKLATNRDELATALRMGRSPAELTLLREDLAILEQLIQTMRGNLHYLMLSLAQRGAPFTATDVLRQTEWWESQAQREDLLLFEPPAADGAAPR